jgi:hypothetical protein
MTNEHHRPDSDPVRRYLDGELEATDLPDALRSEARAWDRLLATIRAEHPREPAPAWLEDRIMGEIEAHEAPGPIGRVWQWLVRPRPFQVPPLAVGLATAGLAALLLLPQRPPVSGPGVDPGTAGAEPVVYVQFLLEAPGARTVSVGGDFDDWEGTFSLTDADGDGVWTGRVPLRPGVHSYMFLVDGADWVTDPEAQRYADDGFGNRNAVLALADPRV